MQSAEKYTPLDPWLWLSSCAHFVSLAPAWKKKQGHSPLRRRRLWDLSCAQRPCRVRWQETSNTRKRITRRPKRKAS